LRRLEAAIAEGAMRRVLGGIVLLMGVGLAGWILLNLLVLRLPQMEGRNPIGPLLFAAAFIYVGSNWLRGKTAR
jgi:hypothetical protein